MQVSRENFPESAVLKPATPASVACEKRSGMNE
jgi:hypothetical protein